MDFNEYIQQQQKRQPNDHKYRSVLTWALYSLPGQASNCTVQYLLLYQISFLHLNQLCTFCHVQCSQWHRQKNFIRVARWGQLKSWRDTSKPKAIISTSQLIYLALLLFLMLLMIHCAQTNNIS